MAIVVILQKKKLIVLNLQEVFYSLYIERLISYKVYNKNLEAYELQKSQN